MDSLSHSYSMPLSDFENGSAQRFIAGSTKNFWIWSSDRGWDLTHPAKPDSEPVDNALHLECEVSNVILDPAKTALLIIDMQNLTLSRALRNNTPPHIYAAEESLVKYAVPAARNLGMQVIWLNWGLTETEIESISPAEVRVFGFRAHSNKTDYGLSDRNGDLNDSENFVKCGEYPNPTSIPGAPLGEVCLEDGTRVDAGRVMMRGAWNSALHTPLAAAYNEGKTLPRPDVWIHKNRNSGLWNADTECATFLEQHGIRTLLLAGVNIDQCVTATMQDAHARGFDTIMLKDGCATDSPSYAQESLEYNSVRNWGFLTSCRALAKAAGIREDS